MSWRLFILFCFLGMPLGMPQALASPQEEPIIVQLAGETSLLPIYLAPIDAKEAELSKEAQEATHQVLTFDLNHNGMTEVFSPKEVATYSSLKGQEAFEHPLDFQKLKDDNILYLVKLRLKGKELIAKVISTNAQTAHTIDNIFLTGDLAQDRVKIHRLADAIHKVLFGKEGIATSHILYCVKRKVDLPKQAPKWVSEIFEADYDGQNRHQVTYDGSYCANPLYIPSTNGTRCSSFLYVSYKIGQPKIYRASLKGSQPTRVSPIRGNQVTPAIAKDSSFIAFSCDVTGKTDIFIQPLPSTQEAGQKPRQIFTAKAAANASPAFSPNGRQIAFVSDKDGSPKIYVIDIPKPQSKLADVKVRLISKRCNENSAPSWSPDGKKLAYCARTQGIRQIWIYDCETGIERQLTQGKTIKENPAWASDSLHLLFNATDSSGSELYLINLNQPEAVKITSGPGAKLFASWEPK